MLCTSLTSQKSWVAKKPVPPAFLLVGLFCVVVTGQGFGDSYRVMFMGVFGRLFDGYPTMLWKYLQEVAILLSLALALTPAFKMKFWNIGAEGLKRIKNNLNMA